MKVKCQALNESRTITDSCQQHDIVSSESYFILIVWLRDIYHRVRTEQVTG